MKTAFTIRVEKGVNVHACTYTVVAATDIQAIRLAKRQAQRDYGVKRGWRCISLTEQQHQVVS